MVCGGERRLSVDHLKPSLEILDALRVYFSQNNKIIKNHQTQR